MFGPVPPDKQQLRYVTDIVNVAAFESVTSAYVNLAISMKPSLKKVITVQFGAAPFLKEAMQVRLEGLQLPGTTVCSFEYQ